jgi:hypothetical protein
MSIANRPAIFIMEILRFGVMKSEIRNPKSEGNPKSEARSQRRSGNAQEARESICRRRRARNCFGIRHSEFFRHSDFGIRIWAIACFSETFDLLRFIPK